MIPEKNIFEITYDQLKELFLVEGNIVTDLISIINEKGVNIKAKDIKIITSKNTSLKEASLILSNLTSCIHIFSYHHKHFIQDYEEFTKDDNYKNSLKKILEKLNETGKNGLNARFEIGREQIFHNRIMTILAKNNLGDIVDEQGKIMAYQPTIDIKFTIKDGESNREKIEKVNFTVAGLESFIDGLTRTLDDVKQSSLTYKEKLGDKVIFEGEEY